MYKIVYLPLAEADILDAVDYIAGKMPRLSTVTLYTTRPMRDEIRKVPVKGYVLYYAVLGDTVEIRRLLHGRRDRQNMVL